MDSNGSCLPVVEKLRGSENYRSWKFQMTNVLKHEALWVCIAGFSEDDRTPADQKARKEEKALSKINLSVDKCVYPHVESAETAKIAWERLQEAFDGVGLFTSLSLLRRLCTLRLDAFNSTEEYVNEAMSVSTKLQDIREPVPDKFLAAVVLQGLPDSYKPMIMALQNSGALVTFDLVKSTLLQDKSWKGDNGDENKYEECSQPAMYTKGFRKKKYCSRCKQSSHWTSECRRSSEDQNSHPPRGEKREGSFSSRNKSKGKPKNKALFASFRTADAFACESNENSWWIDSGSCFHMSGQKKMLRDLSKPETNSQILVANGQSLNVEAIGSSVVALKNSRREISDIKYVPNLHVNLLSVSALVNKGYRVVFDADGCKILDEDSTAKEALVATGSLKNGLYKLDVERQMCANVAKVANLDSHTLWHRRLGHLNHHSMSLLKNGLATGVNFTDNKHPVLCRSCVSGKLSRKPFPYNKNKEVAKHRLDLVHSDLIGPMDPSFGNRKYILTFIDDFSRKIFAYFLKSKDEVPHYFEIFQALVENEAERKIKVWRTDNGTEFCNRKMQSICERSGIKHERSVAYSPSQNGFAERVGRSIMDKTRSMMNDAKLEKRFWAETASTAVYLLNRSPAKKIRGSTPEEKWTGKRVDLSHLKVFGCPAFCHIPKEKRRKLDVKSKEYMFVGYSETSKGYKLMDRKSHEIKIARDVIFDEAACFSPTEMQPRSKRSPAKPSTVPDFVLKEAPHQFLTPAADQLPNLDSDSSSENGQDEDPDSSGGSQLSDETLRPIPPISDDSGSGEFEETEDAVKTIELSSESDTAPPQ
ncbi:unnamed protein product, partial [Nesidiocoris tenuis]